MKKGIIFLFMLLWICPLIAQNQDASWRTMIFDHSNNFHDIQKSFYSEFGDEPGGKGSGWKQFKRWEYYWSRHIDAEGNFLDPNIYAENAKFYTVEKSTDLRTYEPGSGNWEPIGPYDKPNNGTSQPNGNGRVSCITFHPTDPNVIFVGAPSGGFWKSTDLGQTWTQYISGVSTLGVSSIVVHPTNPNIIYIGSGDRDNGASHGLGVYKSTDGGLTWNQTFGGFLATKSIAEILMHPSDPDILIVCTTDGRIYRSIDGATSWNYSQNTSDELRDIAMHPTNPDIIYATGEFFWKSTDNGLSFTQITNGVPSNATRIAIAVSPDRPNRVNILAGNRNGFIGLYRSTNSGTSFSQRSSSPNILGWDHTGGASGGQAWYDLTLASDPYDGNILYAGGINLWKSTNGGSSWTNLTNWASDVHADHHVLTFHPQTNDIFNGNDGGVYTSYDYGNSWTELSSGLGIAQLYKIGVSQTEENLVIHGYQDNGTAVSENGRFRTEIGGDGMECIIDPSDENFMYGSIYYGSIRRSSNKGYNFTTITGNINEQGGWVTPYKLAPDNTNTMYAGMTNIWRNTNVKYGSTWTKISNFPGTSEVIDLAIPPSSTSQMYISCANTNRRFMRCDNTWAGTPTWHNLSSNLPVGVSQVYDIEVDYSDPLHVFILTNNASKKIYESFNGGQTWTDYSSGLPADVKHSIIIDPSSSVDAMYLGTDFGVFYRDNTMSSWALYNTGLPRVAVRELEIYNPTNQCNSKIYAATYGQGVYVSDLRDPDNVEPVSCFSASDTVICKDSDVKFYNYSAFSPSSHHWSISPMTYTFSGGTTRFSEEPIIIFHDVGSYDITLISTNGTGSHTETKTDYIQVLQPEAASLFSENFDQIGTCSETNDCEITTCNISSYWKNLSNGSEDDIDFRVDEDGTPSNMTGPSIDYNTGTTTGNYIYLEASGCYRANAIIQSECIFLDQDYNFEFAYHMFGEHQGKLQLDLFTGGEWIEDIIPEIRGNQGNYWNTVTIDLSIYTFTSIKLRFRGQTGGNYLSDIALDDFKFSPQNPLPLTLLDFDAIVENSSVKLSWSTAQEKNVKEFIIQRSSNGILWEDILSTSAYGSSTTIKNYTNYDYEPLKFLSYYRLKSVDQDGTLYYSDIEKVYFHDNSLAVYPNPADESLTILKTNVEADQITIQNLQGQRQDYEITLQSQHKLILDISGISNGFYFVVLGSVDGTVDVRRIFIN